jgi:hypothetical protein
MSQPTAKKFRQKQVLCPCGNPLKTQDELAMELCEACLDTGIPTEQIKVPIPKGSCLANPEDLNRNALDRMLWLIDWWGSCAQQPEDAEYLAAAIRLEELAAKIRRTV